MAEIQQGLAANGDRPLPSTRAPGYMGTVARVPEAPGHTPGFVAPDVWRPKVQTARATMRSQLESMLGPPR